MHRQFKTYPNMTLLALALQEHAGLGRIDDTLMTTPVKAQTWVEKVGEGIAICIETGGTVYTLFTCNGINLSVDLLPALSSSGQEAQERSATDIVPGAEWCWRKSPEYQVIIAHINRWEATTGSLEHGVVYFTVPGGHLHSIPVKNFLLLYESCKPEPVEIDKVEEKEIVPGGKWCLQANKCHVVRIVGLLTDQGYIPTLPQMVVYTNPSGNNRSRTVEEFRRLFVPYVPPVEVEEDSGGIVKKPTLKSSAKAFKPGRVWRFIHNASDLVTIVCVSTVTIGGRTTPPTVIFTDNAGEEKYMSLYEFQLLYNPVPK